VTPKFKSLGYTYGTSYQNILLAALVIAFLAQIICKFQQNSPHIRSEQKLLK